MADHACSVMKILDSFLVLTSSCLERESRLLWDLAVVWQSCADPEGGGGVTLSNTGLDPQKITKLPSQHSMLGHHRHASEASIKWRFAAGLRK